MRCALTLGLLAAAVAVGQTKSTYTFKKAGDLEIQADVYRPAGDQRLPVVMWIHGGALIGGHRGNLRDIQMKRYVESGFAVVSIDYRLAPEVKAPVILEDVRDAYRWIRKDGPKLFHADPKRIAVVGHSAGGYLTLTCGHRLDPRPRALVSFYGYGDIAADWYAKPDPFYLKQKLVPKEEAYAAVGGAPISGATGPTERGRFYLYCRQQGLWPKEVAGLDPATQNREFDPYSPARNVTKKFPPTMLLHGDADTDVPFAQSEQMDAELTKHGVEHEFIRIPNGPHGFDGRMQDPQVAATFERAVAFLKAHLE